MTAVGRYERLWAKSPPKHDQNGSTQPEPEWILLENHLRAVLATAEQVLRATGCNQLRALGLDPTVWAERLQTVVLLAAALHDLGKANDHFQAMVHRDPERLNRQQGLRHEWLTVLLIAHLEEGLSVAADEDDLRVVRWAISGHHPAYNRSSPPRTPPPGSGAAIQLLVDHRDFQACLRWLENALNLRGLPCFTDPIEIPLVGKGNAFNRIAEIHLKDLWHWNHIVASDNNADTDWVRFVAVVKACLVACDVAGSALPKKLDAEAEQAEWVVESLSRFPTTQQLDEIITDRLTDNDSGQLHTLRPFQKRLADEAGQVTLVVAGCGSGKTLAAYHWARQNHPGHRLYFCYPTTGTATEGFRDYLVSGESPKFDADLFHGRRDIDLDILGVVDTSQDGGEDGLLRLESLEAWSTPIVCCTADTVLGIIQNNRRGLYAWPALATAAFVFDEIHAYDDRLFGALLRFLDAVRGVPVLLMTASLPTHRLRSLEACLSRRSTELTILPGPEEMEALPRYHQLPLVDQEALLETVCQELRSGGKVLWVCNTVDRAIAASRQLAESKPIIYHSRFRYRDRVCRHKEVIDAFKADGPALAICSQVAEMSLDLSATLLVIDLAPVPALIQRLGRLNRRATPGDPTRPFLVIEPQRKDGTLLALPYSPEDFDLARRWLEHLCELDDGKLSQRHLREAWENDPEVQNRRPTYVPSAWLDGGPVTSLLELREVSPGITVIMEDDLPEVLDERSNQRKCLSELTVPMPPPPRTVNWRDWRQVRGVLVAPSEVIQYDAQRGAQWRKSE